jgi:hypothetical protein
MGTSSTMRTITYKLKEVARNFAEEKGKTFAVDQCEAMDMIFHKIGRILNGDPNYADSWIDIAGYAKLVADRLEGKSHDSMTAWSYSSIKTFDQCPKKYFHLKVVKDVKDDPGEAAVYGTAVHEAAELFVKDGTPIPEKFAYMRPIVEPLAAKPGEKLTEVKLGVKKTDTGFEACGFFDKDVWYRGIVDLAIIDGDRAWMVDYKTGKNAKYADLKQLRPYGCCAIRKVPRPEDHQIGAGLRGQPRVPKEDP